MLRATKKGQTSFNVSTLNASCLSTQTTAQTMQREIDNYTRRLEQDKRKFFRAQENYSEIKKQFSNKNKELQVLKSKKTKSQLLALRGKIGTLEATLDQNINSYNEALSKNNKLKCEIDELRKQRKNEQQKIKSLATTLEQVSASIVEKQQEIEYKKVVIQNNKEAIIKVKQINEEQVKKHQEQVHMIKQDFQQAGKQDERTKKDEKGAKTQTVDTQPILKLRLKNLIAKNKQKIRIIDQYKRNMHLIFQNFEQIKQQSGIQDLQEITKTFLKQQEQNLFIYQYMSRLNSTIQSLKQSNDELRNKISEQQDQNKEKRQNLSGTPEEAKRKRDFEQYKERKMKNIKEFDQWVEEIKPKLVQVFKIFKIIGENDDLELNLGNVELYISQLQDLINSSQLPVNQFYKTDFKEDITRYTKLPPNIAQDPKEKPEERLLEKDKLKQLASEYWQKKKATKMTSSKNNESTD